MQHLFSKPKVCNSVLDASSFGCEKVYSLLQTLSTLSKVRQKLISSGCEVIKDLNSPLTFQYKSIHLQVKDTKNTVEVYTVKKPPTLLGFVSKTSDKLSIRKGNKEFSLNTFVDERNIVKDKRITNNKRKINENPVLEVINKIKDEFKDNVDIDNTIVSDGNCLYHSLFNIHQNVRPNDDTFSNYLELKEYLIRYLLLYIQ